ncbi:MAG: cytochrome b/b6 domain-containing protein [Deltaproteobacteria bacterium]|nr:cytochrome b/b6 domain-containing protein [Deltaproteobacteria bacterium]MCL5792780.1 cytochrome b/b6 domain-containing protein [Deltaproteobacteria bacterium]
MADRYKTSKEHFIEELENHLIESLGIKDDQELVNMAKRLIKAVAENDLEPLLDTKLKKIYRIIKKEQKAREKTNKKEQWKEDTFQRFNIYFRIQHIMLFISVIILIITGLPIKFPNAVASKIIMHILGGIAVQGIIHRVGAVLLIAFYLFHTLYSMFNKEGRRDWFALLPRVKDGKDVVRMVKYFFGLSKEKPKFDRFSYIEKFDYWAVYWGGIVMVGSGLIMWFHNLTMMYLPKYVYDIAREAHSDEALLATLTIVIWHFYNVHFNPSRFPGSLVWWHGKLTREQMIDEHPLEYDRISKQVEKE